MLEELHDNLRLSGQREVCVCTHGPTVASEWQRRRNHAVVAPQIADHVAPQRAVHQQAVQQHDWWPRAALLVLERTRAELDVGHCASCFTPTGSRLSGNGRGWFRTSDLSRVKRKRKRRRAA